MMNMRDPKMKKIISTVIVVILVLAMIVPMALSADRKSTRLNSSHEWIS